MLTLVLRRHLEVYRLIKRYIIVEARTQEREVGGGVERGRIVWFSEENVHHCICTVLNIH